MVANGSEPREILLDPMIAGSSRVRHGPDHGPKTELDQGLWKFGPN